MLIIEAMTMCKLCRGYQQAGAELGQAQLKLGLDFNQKYTFGLSKFDLVELVGYILGLTENIWFGTFCFNVFRSD